MPKVKLTFEHATYIDVEPWDLSQQSIDELRQLIGITEYDELQLAIDKLPGLKAYFLKVYPTSLYDSIYDTWPTDNGISGPSEGGHPAILREVEVNSFNM